MRILLRAELLWADSRLSVETFVTLPRMTPRVLRGALASLLAGGVIEFDEDEQRIRLSEQTRRDLAMEHLLP